MNQLLQQARERIAKFAEHGGAGRFAREVRAGCWDRRSDIQSELRKLTVASLAQMEAPELKRRQRELVDADTSEWDWAEEMGRVFVLEAIDAELKGRSS